MTPLKCVWCFAEIFASVLCLCISLYTYAYTSVLNFSKALLDRPTPATAVGTHISVASAGMQIATNALIGDWWFWILGTVLWHEFLDRWFRGMQTTKQDKQLMVPLSAGARTKRCTRVCVHFIYIYIYIYIRTYVGHTHRQILVNTRQ